MTRQLVQTTSDTVRLEGAGCVGGARQRWLETTDSDTRMEKSRTNGRGYARTS